MELENDNDDNDEVMDDAEEEEDDESMSDDDDDSSDYSDDTSVESGYGNLLEHALYPPAAPAPPADTRTPLERWRDYLTKIRSRQTKVLKFVDAQLDGELSFLSTLDEQNNTEDGEQAVDTSWKSELLEAITTAAVNPEDASTSGFLTHGILGPHMLRLLGPDGQKQVFLAIASHATLAYLELQGMEYTRSNMSTATPLNDKPTVLSMAAVIDALGAYDTPALSEMELLGVQFPSMQAVKQWAVVLEKRRGTLRQVNLVGIEPPTSEEACPSLAPGWLDPILLALAVPSADMTTPLDELKLIMRQSRSDTNKIPVAITPQALGTLLLHKKKWWRLSLDGLGLGDEHLHVLTTMFRRDETCKANDLLSLERNPNITSRAYEEFFEGCFFWKRRMGLIKVDSKDWEQQFDLVRSMNNLHNRLDYVVSVGKHSANHMAKQQQRSPKCSFASRDMWVAWLAKLGTGLAWEDDKHRINYLWFTLLEKPEFILQS